MPDLSLLTPAVATAAVKNFAVPDTFTWYGNVPTTPMTASQTAYWEVTRGTYNIAQPNTVDAEANIAPRKGKTLMAAALLNSREKKLLPGSLVNWSQVSGFQTDAERERAESVVLTELQDLKGRIDRLVEWSLWQAVQGVLTLNTPDVSAVVDYNFLPSHKFASPTSWATATAAQIRADVLGIKNLIQNDGRVRATDAYCSQATLDTIYTALSQGNAPLMTDQMKQDYTNGGAFTTFMGLNWHIVAETYNSSADQSLINYLPEGRVIFGNFSDNSPIKLAEGTTGDTEIDQFTTGVFSKSWDSHDPSGRVVLCGMNFLPIVERPDQIVVLDALH